MNHYEELSSDEITESLAQPPQSTRKKKEVVLDRTVTGWFKLQHTRAVNCTNETQDLCIDPRPRSITQEATLMVYKMSEEVAICRYCYVGGYGV